MTETNWDEEDLTMTPLDWLVAVVLLVALPLLDPILRWRNRRHTRRRLYALLNIDQHRDERQRQLARLRQPAFTGTDARRRA